MASKSPCHRSRSGQRLRWHGKALSQSSFDPFGQLLNRDDLDGGAAFRRCDVGHQGLFFEPYKDELVAYDGTEDRLSPSNPGLYFNRARWYDAERGRFTTSDPNATGMPVVGSVGWHGMGPVGLRPGLNVIALYRDGVSLYARGGGNPYRLDPSGLSDLGSTLAAVGGMGAGMTTGMKAALMAMIFVDAVIADWRYNDGAATRAAGRAAADVLDAYGRYGAGAGVHYPSENWEALNHTTAYSEDTINSLVRQLSGDEAAPQRDADPAEGWPSPEESVPYDKAAKDGEVTLKLVDSAPVKNQPAMVEQGYTEREYYRDANGNKWSIFHNPKGNGGKGSWKGTKLSSEQ